MLRAYHSRCAFCGYDLRLDGALVGIEAAHIHWKTYGGPCVVNNGLALCSLHHDAFDMGAFGLDENLTIRISGGVSRSPVVDNLFWQRNGQQLHLPHDKSLWPTEQYVGWHRKQIFKPETVSFAGIIDAQTALSPTTDKLLLTPIADKSSTPVLDFRITNPNSSPETPGS